MYKPKFNHVLVEIDDKGAEWGKSSDGNIGGEVWREGTVLELGELVPHKDYPLNTVEAFDLLVKHIRELKGKQIMWNEGHEAGTVFEENGKKYCLIYWWDIIGVKDEQ